MSFEYFKGDGSFIKNNYAIFREGLGDQDPNPIALDRGYEAGYLSCFANVRHAAGI